MDEKYHTEDVECDTLNEYYMKEHNLKRSPGLKSSVIMNADGRIVQVCCVRHPRGNIEESCELREGGCFYLK
jgi:hypothetical protein